MSHRLPKILQRPRRPEPPQRTELSAHPIVFTCCDAGGQVIKQYHIPRNELGRLMEVAKPLELRMVRFVSLHGLTRLTWGQCRRLARDLRELKALPEPISDEWLIVVDEVKGDKLHTLMIDAG